MDMSTYERLVQDDVETLGYFPAETGMHQLVLISGRPYLARVDTVPLKLEPLSPTRFSTVASSLLDGATQHLEAVVICGPDLFLAGLSDRAHDVRLLQQLELG